MNCYFCNEQLYPEDGQKWVVQCLGCAQKFDLYKVYTSYKDNNMYIAHIYVYINANLFHIRLCLDTKTTDISPGHVNVEAVIATIPGFPINLNNVKQKLETILTFL